MSQFPKMSNNYNLQAEFMDSISVEFERSYVISQTF